jgi:hypothetical protein
VHLLSESEPTFPGAACVGALVDRCHVIDIDADSWRQRRVAMGTAEAAPAGSSPRLSRK